MIESKRDRQALIFLWDSNVSKKQFNSVMYRFFSFAPSLRSMLFVRSLKTSRLNSTPSSFTNNSETWHSKKQFMTEFQNCLFKVLMLFFCHSVVSLTISDPIAQTFSQVMPSKSKTVWKVYSTSDKLLGIIFRHSYFELFNVVRSFGFG